LGCQFHFAGRHIEAKNIEDFRIAFVHSEENVSFRNVLQIVD
jgi:hypothetical protein